MYNLGFRVEPVIDCMAVGHASLEVMFVGTKSNRMFQHRIWRRNWRHYSDGVHVNQNTISRFSNRTLQIPISTYLFGMPQELPPRRWLSDNGYGRGSQPEAKAG